MLRLMVILLGLIYRIIYPICEKFTYDSCRPRLKSSRIRHADSNSICCCCCCGGCCSLFRAMNYIIYKVTDTNIILFLYFVKNAKTYRAFDVAYIMSWHFVYLQEYL